MLVHDENHSAVQGTAGRYAHNAAAEIFVEEATGSQFCLS